MEHTLNIKETLKTYYRINSELFSEGGPTQNGEKYLQKVHIEKKILAFFGLPLKSKYVKLIWNTFEITENMNDAIAMLMQTLSHQSKLYESTKHKQIDEKLKLALENKSEAFEFLPEINIDLNLYTLFIYNEIFIQRKEPLLLIIQELDKINNKASISNIYQLSLLSDNYEQSIYYKTLVNQGLIYIDDFVAWCKLRDKHTSNTPIDLKIKNEDAIQSLRLAFQLFLHYKQKGYTLERAKKHSGLSNERVFKIVQYVYTHT